jgi:GNAT superfamily N-acetyltransferase
MSCVITEGGTGVRNSFLFDAVCHGVYAGTIRVYKTRAKVRRKTLWVVAHISVEDRFRRRGVATRLYEAAAQEACRKRGHLASLERSFGAYSLDFWLKQEELGRAMRVPRPREYNKISRGILDAPLSPVATKERRDRIADMYDAFILDCDYAADLSEL